MSEAKRRFTSQKLREFIQTGKGKTYTVAVVTGVLVLILFLFGIFPSVSAILLQFQQNSERVEALSALESYEQTLRTLATQLQDEQEIVNALNEAFPETEQEEQLIADINAAANDYDVIIDSYQFTENVNLRSNDVIAQNPNINVHRLTISYRGSRSDVQSLVEAVEGLKRIVNISSLNVSKLATTQVENGRTHSGSIQADYYTWQPIVSEGDV